MRISFFSNTNLITSFHSSLKGGSSNKMLSIPVDDVKKKIQQGYTQKEIADYYGVNLAHFRYFLRRHSDEIDYKSIKRDAFKNTVRTAANADELSKKLRISYQYANVLKNRSFDDNKTIVERKRDNRLAELLPLLEEGYSVRAAASKMGWSIGTLASDIEYYNSVNKDKPIKRFYDANRNKRLEMIVPAVEQGVSVQALARNAGCSIDTIKSDIEYYNSQNKDNPIISSAQRKRDERLTKEIPLLEKGMSLEEISSILGYSIVTIERDLSYYKKSD